MSGETVHPAGGGAGPAARETVLGRVRRALAVLPERAAYPEWDDAVTVAASPFAEAGASLEEVFRRRWEANHGVLPATARALAEWLRKGGWTRGWVAPELAAVRAVLVEAGFELVPEVARERIDEAVFAVTPAAGAIAETGTVILHDVGGGPRLAALAPWVHVAVVRRVDLLRDVPAAVARLGADPNVVWVTGPSKTADVEGILIEGVHGPGVQACLFVDG